MHTLRLMNQRIKYVLFSILLILSACRAGRELPVVIATEKLQVLYNGLENPMVYAQNGIHCKDIIVVAEKGRAEVKQRENCHFSVRPLGTWKEGLELSFYNKQVDEEHLLEKRNLRIAKIPLPVASLNGNSGSSISMGALKAVRIVSVVLEGFVFEGLRYQASSFSYLVVKAETKEVITRGQQLGKEIPDDLSRIFGDLQKGDLVHIFNIMAKANDPRLPEVPVQNDLSLWVN